MLLHWSIKRQTQAFAFEHGIIEDFIARHFNKDHSVISTSVASSVQFLVGMAVTSKKAYKLTVTHGRLREKHNITIQKGQPGRIQEINDKHVKVKYTATVTTSVTTEHTVIQEVDIKDLVSLEPPPAATTGSTDPSADLGPAMQKGYEFARAPCKEVSVIKWPTDTPGGDRTQVIHSVKAAATFVMSAVASKVPEFGKGDLAMILRDKQTEVWTLRKFKAGELLLAPETTELKD